MKNQNKNNTRVVKMYRYFYPGIMPQIQQREVESPDLVKKCLMVEEIRSQNKMPIFSLSTQSLLAENLLTGDF